MIQKRWAMMSLIIAAVTVVMAVQSTETNIGPFKPVDRSKPITYDITAMLVFTPPLGTKVAHVWLVKPPDDEGQQVLAFETEPPPTVEAPDPLYGNHLVYFRFDNPDGAQVIRYRLKIRVWELRWHLEPNKVKTYLEASASEWLRSESRIVANDPNIRTVAQKAMGNATEPFERVRRILQFVMDTMTYSHSECSLQASALNALTKRIGHCSDYHGFATALLRSVGVPARITYGVNPFKRRSPSHCKVEVFLLPYGWVPFDLSETDKVLEQLAKSDLPSEIKTQKREEILRWLFSGFRDNTWFRVTIGSDFPVVPPVAPNPPVIRTAYIVCDDQVLPDPDPANPNKLEFAWQLVWDAKPDQTVVFPWSLWLKP